MSLIDILLLAGAGFAAGVVNAVAGGGTFFTFGALVAAGLPTLNANATSALALTPANIASVVAYRREIMANLREAAIFAGLGAAGGIAGALLLMRLGDVGFRPFLPWLLLFATCLFAISGHLRTIIAPIVASRSLAVRFTASALVGILSIYGGFFGAGMGIMLLAAMAVIEAGNYHKANSIKNVVAMMIQLVAVVVFIGGGLVSWPHGLVAMTASVVGGYLGVDVARRVPERVVRAVVVTIGAALTVIFFMR